MAIRIPVGFRHNQWEVLFLEQVCDHVLGSSLTVLQSERAGRNRTSACRMAGNDTREATYERMHPTLYGNQNGYVFGITDGTENVAGINLPI